MNDRRPTAFEVLAAILDAVADEICYSGSEIWEIESTRDLRSPEADGGEPFAVELRLKGHAEPYILILASDEDVPNSERMAPAGTAYRKVHIEVDDA